MSVAGRKAIAEAQRKRWARIRGGSEPTVAATQKPPKSKRRISEEGMRRIIAATKKRWRLAKAAKAQPAAVKKTASARKKVAVKKAAPAKAVKKAAPAKKAAVKKATASKTAPVAAQAVAEAAAQ